jgi:2-polyprenyl-3-methyl-5-hydroxy-6-metoxy-1,4-benzoquinol methylase
VARNYTLYQKHKFLKSLTDNKTILDYGCGTGQFINYFKEKNWKTIGVEPDETARKLSHQKDLEVVEHISEIKNKKFAVITLWHVLEHIHDINETISKIRKLLTKTGTLVIAVPNYESLDQQIYKEHWAAYDVPRHLYHFNQLTIKELMKYNGFDLVETKPMILDAYYVSILSEKIKNNKNNLLKSIVNGWKSNRWASKNNINYSSLIYVFKKS